MLLDVVKATGVGVLWGLHALLIALAYGDALRVQTWLLVLLVALTWTATALVFELLRHEQHERGPDEPTRPTDSACNRDTPRPPEGGCKSLRVAPDGDVGSSRVDLQACKLEYSIVSPK